MRQRSFFLLLLFTILGNTLSAQSIRSLLRKGKQQYEVHAYTKAIETYQEVLERRSDQVEALSYLATCYRQLNQMEEAADHYALALEQANQMADVHILEYGKTLKALERYAQAEQIFRIYAERNAPLGNHYAASCEFAVGQQGIRSNYQVTNELVNSSAADFGPSFFMDQVVFSSGRTDIERPNYDPIKNEPWDGQARNQLFISRIGQNGLLQPARFLKGAASKRSEGPVSFSPRQDKVAFMVNDYISGTRTVPGQGNELVLFVADLGSNGDWFNERTFPHNTAESQSGYPCFTPDGGAMFFASNRAGGYGGYDLYIAYREGENWSIPINLGPTVNSPGDEIAPFTDGESLYFASDYHFGFGGFDIFIARQEEGTWVEVKNIGLPINSSRDDYGFIFDEVKNIGYFTSNRPGGRGAEDLYKVNKPSLNKISLQVVSAIDGRPISFANIDLSGLGAVILEGNTNVITNSEGRYTIPSAYGINGMVLVSSPGYQSENYPLNAASLNDNQEVIIRLSPAGRIYTGSVVRYSNNQPLSNVTIIAKQLNNGISRQTRTDQNGNFQLSLEENTSYMLTYTSPGFREIGRNINTASIANSDLGVLSLASTSDINHNPVPPPSPDSPPRKGYAIQIAAMGQHPYLEEFSNLNSLNIGRVYIKSTDNIYRVRYGVFTDRVTANRYLSSVKAKGYRDAFVVLEEGTAVLPGLGSNSNNESGNSAPTGAYQIQLAAMKNVSWFNPSGTVRALGQIEQFPRGNLTIMLLGKFSSLQEAKQALRIVQSNGYPTAFVVVQQNGQLIRP